MKTRTAERYGSTSASLDRVIPHGRYRLESLRMPVRLASAASIVVAGVFAAGATAAVLAVTPNRGLEIDERSMQVTTVFPGGPTWENGIRPGQRIVEITADPQLGHWSIETEDSGMFRASNAGLHVSKLRDSAPGAAASVVLAAIGVVFLRRRPALATGAASAAVMAASWPIAVTGDPVHSTFAMAAAPVAGASWLAGWRPAVLPAGVASNAFRAACVVAAVWVASRFVFPEFYSTAEFARLTLTIGGAAALIAFAFPWREWLMTRPLEPARALDVVLLGSVLAVAIVGTLVYELPPWVSPVAIGLLLVVYPLARRVATRGFDRVVFSSLRERAALDGVEDERARLAGQIHDVPLQELAGVIHRLDTKRDAREEAELLREVAGHLREITTDLRPPVLDDLGLGPALAFLVDRAAARHPDIAVTCSVTDRTDVDRARRAPPVVELAVYRIAEEAVRNACRHAGASTVRIEGEVARDAIALSVTDDGAGIDPERTRAARRQGRLGIASMEQRADAIDASFAVTRADPAGTRVAVTWRAP